MTPRKYEMKVRAARLDDTRERILDAALTLHTRHGILGTSYRQIAELADVSVGTVYNHFPSLDELVPACGALLMERIRPPSPAEADAVAGDGGTVDDRLGRVAAALFAFYERGGAHLHVFPDERELPAVAGWEEELRATVTAFVRAAARPTRASGPALDAAAALLDLPTYEAFRARGVATSSAAAAAARAAATVLEGRKRDRPRRPKEAT